MSNRIHVWGIFGVGLNALLACGGTTIEPIDGAGAGASNAGGSPNAAGSSNTGATNTGANTGVGATSSGTGPVNTAGALNTAGTSNAANTGGSGPDVDPENAEELSGSYTGYVENFKFSDGTDVVKLTLNLDGTGELTVGTAAPPADATNANVGYPPGNGATPGLLALAPGSVLVPGVSYALRNTQLRNLRVQLDVNFDDLWAGWCALQTPVADEQNPGVFECAHNWGWGSDGTTCTQTNPVTKESITVDCGKLQLCLDQQACACDASSCRALTGGPHFDMALDGAPLIHGARLDGSIGSLAAGNVNVHLIRD